LIKSRAYLDLSIYLTDFISSIKDLNRGENPLQNIKINERAATLKQYLYRFIIGILESAKRRSSQLINVVQIRSAKSLLIKLQNIYVIALLTLKH